MYVAELQQILSAFDYPVVNVPGLLAPATSRAPTFIFFHEHEIAYRSLPSLSSSSSSTTAPASSSPSRPDSFPIFLAPSLSPVCGTHPAVRVLSVSNETGALADLADLYLDLETATAQSARSVAQLGVQWSAQVSVAAQLVAPAAPVTPSSSPSAAASASASSTPGKPSAANTVSSTDEFVSSTLNTGDGLARFFVAIFASSEDAGSSTADSDQRLSRLEFVCQYQHVRRPRNETVGSRDCCVSCAREQRCLINALTPTAWRACVAGQ